MKLFARLFGKPTPPPRAGGVEELSPNFNDSFARGLVAYGQGLGYAPAVSSILDGDKFAGGFGTTNVYTHIDYWTLRERSGQLFRENLYAKGLVRRLITNEINT